MLQPKVIFRIPNKVFLIAVLVICLTLNGCTGVDQGKNKTNSVNSSGFFDKAYLGTYDFLAKHNPSMKTANENLRQINTFLPVTKIKGKEELCRNLEDTLLIAKYRPYDFNAISGVGNVFYDIADSLYNDDQRLEGTKYYNFAAIMYSKALDMEYDSGVAIDYANSCMYSNKYDTAEYMYQEVIKKEPNNPIANLDYGIFLSDIRLNKTEAEKYLNLAANQTDNIDITNKAKEILDELNKDQ